MPFKRGQSGNPAGRPVGSRNKRTIVAEKLFSENGEYFTQLLIDLAEKGHSRALRLYIDLFCPRAKRRRAAFRLPPVATASDALGAINALVQGVAHGELAPKRAAELSMKVRTALQVAHESGMRQRRLSVDRLTPDCGATRLHPGYITALSQMPLPESRAPSSPSARSRR